jgi:hypothetical protein
MRIIFGVGPIIFGKRQGGPRGRSDEFWHAARAEIALAEAMEAARVTSRGDARRVGDFGSTSPPMRAG